MPFSNPRDLMPVLQALTLGSLHLSLHSQVIFFLTLSWINLNCWLRVTFMTLCIFSFFQFFLELLLFHSILGPEQNKSLYAEPFAQWSWILNSRLRTTFVTFSKKNSKIFWTVVSQYSETNLRAFWPLAWSNLRWVLADVDSKIACHWRGSVKPARDRGVCWMGFRV